MLVKWTLLWQLVTSLSTTEPFFIPGVSSLTTYLDPFQGVAEENMTKLSISELRVPLSRFIIGSESPKTLKDFLLPATNRTNQQHDWSTNHSIVVVSRASEADKRGGNVQWKIISAPVIKNDPLEPFSKNQTEEANALENNLDLLLNNEDLQSQTNDYKDLLYTFKDFVKIGASSKVQDILIEKTGPTVSGKKSFNVTYIMPIPKSKKYFEIKLSNLTELQYNEINTLLQEHMMKKANRSQPLENVKDSVLYVEEDNRGKYPVVEDLKTSSNSSFSKLKGGLRDLSNSDAKLNIEKIFSENKYEEYYNIFKNKSGMNSANQVIETVDSTGNSTSRPLLKNNGFHAEIATDYIEKHDVEGSNVPNSSENEQANYLDLNSKRQSKLIQSESTQPEDSVTETATTILNPVSFRKNITKVSEPKRPFGYRLAANQNRRKNLMKGRSEVYSSPKPQTNSDIQPRLEIIHSPTQLNNKRIDHNVSDLVMNYVTLIHSALSKTLDSDNQTNSVPLITGVQNLQDNLELVKNNSNTTLSDESKLLNSQLTLNETLPVSKNKIEDFDSPDVMKTLQLILSVKKIIDDEKKSRDERVTNYIKKYLIVESPSVIAKGENTSVMKVNREDDTFEELKQLMLAYLDDMNFNTFENSDNSSLTADESLRNATNIFELMERSSHIVKLNMQKKMLESKEPMGFVNRIVESQVDKCKQIFNASVLAEARQKSPKLFKKNSYKRYLMFTNCMNYKLKSCIKGFCMWLEKGKFHLRPQFKLDRAYENYEIERNLYCLRKYNASSLDSSPHGVRVRPGVRVNRKYGSRRVPRFRMRKLRNGGHGRGEAKREYNRQRNTEYFSHNRSGQRPSVQRYSDQRRQAFIKRMNGEGMQQHPSDIKPINNLAMDPR